jgi:hypothetical protein
MKMEINILVDDLDGRKEGVERRPLVFEGVAYDLDLCEDNMAQLREALSRFLAVARPRRRSEATKASVQPPSKKAAHNDPAQLAEIRRWLRAHGYKLADHGRIPNNLMETWQKLAHPSSQEREKELVTPTNGEGIAATLFSDAQLAAAANR